MDDILSLLQRAFQTFDNIKVAGLSLNMWVVVCIIIVGISIIFRGNKS